MTSTTDPTQQTEEAEKTREPEGAAPPPGPDTASGAWDDGLIARRAGSASATGGGQPLVPVLPAPHTGRPAP
ncbi:ATP-binding protein, partial [Streptomyces albidoflavus]